MASPPLYWMNFSAVRFKRTGLADTLCIPVWHHRPSPVWEPSPAEHGNIAMNELSIIVNGIQISITAPKGPTSPAGKLLAEMSPGQVSSCITSMAHVASALVGSPSPSNSPPPPSASGK